MSNSAKRFQLSNSTEAMKTLLVKAFEYLQAQKKSHWYVSCVYEMRNPVTIRINPQGQNLNEELKEGMILRVFDGNTLFEEAFADKSEEAILKRAKSLVEKVNMLSTATGDYEAYTSPSWSERLKKSLEKEITTQIPERPKSDQWVHFGAPIKNGQWKSQKELMDFTAKSFKKLTDRGAKLPKDAPEANPQTYLSMMGSETSEFLFVDSSVRMSQAIQRNRHHILAIKDGKRGMAFMGGIGGKETVALSEDAYGEVFENLKKVVTAEPIQPGRYPLLMSPAITGVFAHEAFGHTQEGDTWARGRSLAREYYEDKVKVGNEKATILNNPAIYENGTDGFPAWGSYYFDEEGWLPEKQYLVKEGYLQPPMTNLTSSLRLGVERTANGKRESWTHGMYVRQTNTYFEHGRETFDDLVKKIDYGFLATYPYGGMEDPKGMGIQVGIQYLEEIKGGKFTGKTFVGPGGSEIQMTGSVPEYLHGILGASKIEAKTSADDTVEHPWNEPGGCGKYHKESVEAGSGGPFLLVDNVLLG